MLYPLAMSRSPQIVILSGSPRRRSYTLSLAHAVAEALRRRGAAVDLTDLRQAGLPPSDPDHADDPAGHPDAAVRALAARVAAADAVVLATPVYHNSYSGLLKNALDSLPSRLMDAKPVGLIGHGGNRSTQAVDHLRIVVRGMAGVAIPSQVCTAKSDYAPAADAEGLYELTAADIGGRIDRLCDQLLSFSAMMRASA